MSSYRDAQPPGLEKTAELHTWDSPRSCPRCKFGLYCGKKDDLELDACGRCGGVWLRSDQASRALSTGSRAHEELASKVERATRAAPVRETGPLLCPECAKRMTRGTVEGVPIDTCSHGTWFDRTELIAIMRSRRGELSSGRGLDAVFLREHADRERWGPLMSAVEAVRRLLR
ncbi:MAG: zf-TFIIB domain-containing protein [Myxococcales bacterium]|nr:zf-TFIIB domain-containing protein [Myxococcales bacterium]HQY60819.1 zf-TFIIB domain-containing protein [Polyangiaceae bacterium]